MYSKEKSGIKLKKLYYVTYQSFPAQTANSIQTISNIKYFVRNNYDVTLFFPLREKRSSANLNDIQSFYSFNDKFIIRGIKHYLPFGRIKFFKKILFHISHFLWSLWVIFFILRNEDEPEYYLTRSDWVLLFLGLQNKNVIFECHQFSKIRRIVLNLVIKKKNVKVIFLNQELLKYSKFSSTLSNKLLVAHNGFDEDLISENPVNKADKIVFVGSLTRFNEDRGLRILLDAFDDQEIKNRYSLTIVGGPEDEASKLQKYLLSNNMDAEINIVGPKTRLEISEYLREATIGILINTSLNIHSYLFSSPLKYFEYVSNQLKVLAVDFPAHRELPYSENIVFFEEGNEESLIKAIKNSSNIKPLKFDEIKALTVNERVKKIIEFANS